MRAWLAGSLLLSALAYAPLVSANDVHVDSNGSDSPTCGTSGSPCATIQYALRRLEPSGGRVLIRPGNYRGFGTTLISAGQPYPPNVIIMADPSSGSGRVVINDPALSGPDGRGVMVWLHNTRGWTIENIDIAPPTNHDAGIIISSPDFSVAENNTVRNVRVSNEGGVGILVWRANRTAIENTDIDGAMGALIGTGSVNGLRVIGCRFTNSRWAAVYLGSFAVEGSVRVPASLNNIRLERNFIGRVNESTNDRGISPYLAAGIYADDLINASMINNGIRLRGVGMAFGRTIAPTTAPPDIQVFHNSVLTDGSDATGSEAFAPIVLLRAEGVSIKNNVLLRTAENPGPTYVVRDGSAIREGSIDYNVIGSHEKFALWFRDGTLGMSVGLDDWQGVYHLDQNSRVATPNEVFDSNSTSLPLHISMNSPALNNGTSLGVLDDFDGNPRDGMPDIGFDEFVANVVPNDAGSDASAGEGGQPTVQEPPPPGISVHGGACACSTGGPRVSFGGASFALGLGTLCVALSRARQRGRRPRG